ncbi:MAG: hypothetical protein MI923_01195 [Phycisphaerales bacterium]|nr:hypothetical protein [Phycisphaerales bacterium]
MRERRAQQLRRRRIDLHGLVVVPDPDLPHPPVVTEMRQVPDTVFIVGRDDRIARGGDFEVWIDRQLTEAAHAGQPIRVVHALAVIALFDQEHVVGQFFFGRASRRALARRTDDGRSPEFVNVLSPAINAHQPAQFIIDVARQRAVGRLLSADLTEPVVCDARRNNRAVVPPAGDAHDATAFIVLGRRGGDDLVVSVGGALDHRLDVIQRERTVDADFPLRDQLAGIDVHDLRRGHRDVFTRLALGLRWNEPQIVQGPLIQPLGSLNVHDALFAFVRKDRRHASVGVVVFVRCREIEGGARTDALPVRGKRFLRRRRVGIDHLKRRPALAVVLVEVDVELGRVRGREVLRVRVRHTSGAPPLKIAVRVEDGRLHRVMTGIVFVDRRLRSDDRFAQRRALFHRNGRVAVIQIKVISRDFVVIVHVRGRRVRERRAHGRIRIVNLRGDQFRSPRSPALEASKIMENTVCPFLHTLGLEFPVGVVLIHINEAVVFLVRIFGGIPSATSPFDKSPVVPS